MLSGQKGGGVHPNPLEPPPPTPAYRLGLVFVYMLLIYKYDIDLGKYLSDYHRVSRLYGIVYT